MSPSKESFGKSGHSSLTGNCTNYCYKQKLLHFALVGKKYKKPDVFVLKKKWVKQEGPRQIGKKKTGTSRPAQPTMLCKPQF